MREKKIKFFSKMNGFAGFNRIISETGKTLIFREEKAEDSGKKGGNPEKNRQGAEGEKRRERKRTGKK